MGSCGGVARTESEVSRRDPIPLECKYHLECVIDDCVQELEDLTLSCPARDYSPCREAAANLSCQSPDARPDRPPICLFGFHPGYESIMPASKRQKH